MNVLPSVDLGLMAEHLTAHEGVINKLNVYHEKVTNTDLKEIIALQANMMRVHVGVMLALINPYQKDYVEVPPLNTYISSFFPRRVSEHKVNFDNKWIALEAHTTAKCMSNENYFSALMMKDSNVRNAHVEMALQQLAVLAKYADFIKSMGWSFVPNASIEEQVNTYQHYKYMLDQ